MLRLHKHIYLDLRIMNNDDKFLSVNCLGGCNPPQIVNLSYAVSDMSSLKIYGNCDEYDKSVIQYSYSVDNVCWSCFMSYNDCLANTVDLNSDFYIKVKISGVICKIELDDQQIYDYTTQLASDFSFSSEESSNLYNPYANMDAALELQQQLAENVSSIVGVPIYYFKLSPNVKSKDITFKEYALMDVEAVKQIKLVIADGQLPSSKPEFADWGLEFQTDWETEITKQSFATAFGNTAQPLEGDLIYIPMMKRMWMVNGAYEEKNGSLMWQATTFKVMLVKYQEKGSVDLGETEELVNSFVKNKYEDLFGDDNNQTYDSGEASTDAPVYAANTLYSVFESDATRKYMTCDSIEIIPNDLYYRGVLISDSKYSFPNNLVESKIIYQNQFCGSECTCSFIIFPFTDYYEGELIHIGDLSINIKQNGFECELYVSKDPNNKISIVANNSFLCVLRFSKCMNLIDFNAYEYTYNKNIPVYKLQKNHYWFNMDTPASSYVSKYNIEYSTTQKSDIYVSNLHGYITNFKIFDVYNDNLSELLQMYPTHQHLMINDTARKIVGRPGVALR